MDFEEIIDFPQFSIHIGILEFFLFYLYLCERGQNCDASLTCHGNGGVNAPSESDMYQEH